jgi:hypothetical protein
VSVVRRRGETGQPPSGSNWIHEIKHDGYRLMARRDPVGIRLLIKRGTDWSARFFLVAEAVNNLKVRSCLIDGEVVCCDERGSAIFQLLRQRRNEATAFAGAAMTTGAVTAIRITIPTAAIIRTNVRQHPPPRHPQAAPNAVILVLGKAYVN